MGRSHERHIRASCEHCSQGCGSVCGQVLRECAGELLFLGFFALAVASLILPIAVRLCGLHFLFVLGPNEAAIDHCLAMVFKRYDCSSKSFFLCAILSRLTI